MNSVCKPCHGALYSASQSRCSILSHDALHHCFSSNRSLENSEREPGHLSRYYRNCKNTSRIVFRKHAYPATGNSRVHYLKSSYVIQLIAFRWDKACIRSSPDPSLSCGSGSGLRDYLVPSPLLERCLGTRLTPTFADTFRVLLSIGLPPSYVHTQYANMKGRSGRFHHSSCAVMSWT